MLSPDQQKAARRHVLRLAEKHDVLVHWTKAWDTSEVDVATRQVFVPKRIRTGVDYLACLHELGHILDGGAVRSARAYYDPETNRRDKPYRLAIEEATAWAWAVRYALPSVLEGCTERDWARIGSCWVSYAKA